MSYIIVIGAFQALVAIWLFSQKSRREPSNYLAICFLSAIACHLFIKFFIFNVVPDDSIKQQMNTFIAALYGPLLFLFTLSTTKSRDLYRKWYIFMPFIILTILYLTISLVFVILKKVDHQLLNNYNTISIILLTFTNIFYPAKVLNILRLKKDSAILMQHKNFLSLVSFGLIMLALIGIFSKAISLLDEQLVSELNLPLRFTSYGILLIITLLFIKLLFIQKVNSVNAEPIPDSKPPEPIHFVNPTITADENPQGIAKKIEGNKNYGELWKKLDDYVKENELFRDSDLNLDELANKTKINKYQISEVLNNFSGKPFYRYINEYRIGYFKKIMQKAVENNEELNFIVMAYESGFNSKSSFNRYFKEIEGKTPSDYYKHIKASPSV